jgi:hypothetical protein
MKQFTPPEIAKAIAITSFSALTAIAAAPAQAVVMDFNSLPSNTGFTTYTEKGFTIDIIDNANSAIFAAQYDFGSGSQAILTYVYSPAFIRLTRVGGGAFSLSSIDLNTDYLALSRAFVLFKGNTASGNTVTQTFTTDTDENSSQTLAFNSNFTDLVSVDWSQSFESHVFDNINVSAIESPIATAVPEPFTILGTLFGAGYGVAFKRKLAKAQQEEREEV